MGKEPAGCLGFLFELLGLGPGEGRSNDGPLPYRRRDDFLSAAELKFFHFLRQVVGQHFHVCAKVRIGDLLYVVNRNKNMGHANRIERKHVDFVLCDPASMQPKLVIELDDSSHQRPDRQERDRLVDAAFSAASFPILHVRCRSQYSPDELSQQIREALNPVAVPNENSSPTATLAPPPLAEPANTANPICPRCNILMVQRTASRGKHKGKRFWACPSYPDCKKIVAID